MSLSIKPWISVDSETIPKFNRARIMSRTSSLSEAVTFISSFKLSSRYSSSNGDPSLTVRFFLSFCFCYFFSVPWRFDFLDVSETPLRLLDPEVIENCDSLYAEAPDIDSWSASNLLISLPSTCSSYWGTFFLVCWTILSLSHFLSNSASICNSWFLLTSYAILTWVLTVFIRIGSEAPNSTIS